MSGKGERKVVRILPVMLRIGGGTVRMRSQKLRRGESSGTGDSENAARSHL
jgi:hypothetical protein